MNSFMGSCNLYRNWQSILTLFAVLSFAWTIPISRHRQCHCSLTIVFSVFNVHLTKRIPPFALETKKARFDPANLFSCDRRGTKTRSLFYRLVSCYFVNLFSSLRRSFLRHRAEWEYKSKTLSHYHQMVFLISLRKYVLLQWICNFEEWRTYF